MRLVFHFWLSSGQKAVDIIKADVITESSDTLPVLFYRTAMCTREMFAPGGEWSSLTSTQVGEISRKRLAVSERELLSLVTWRARESKYCGCVCEIFPLIASLCQVNRRQSLLYSLKGDNLDAHEDPWGRVDVCSAWDKAFSRLCL